MASLARLPPDAVAQSLPALAHRDLLGPARGRNHFCTILEVYLDASPGAVALFAVGRPNAVGQTSGSVHRKRSSRKRSPNTNPQHELSVAEALLSCTLCCFSSKSGCNRPPQ